ncbi:MAG: hypothetical protein ABIF11_05575 [Nitrospirota bacterium]
MVKVKRNLWSAKACLRFIDAVVISISPKAVASYRTPKLANFRTPSCKERYEFRSGILVQI